MKEKVPLAILEALNPASNENLQYVSAHDEQGTILLLKDKSPTSDFYYKIIKKENRSSGLHFQVEYKPKAKENTDQHQRWLLLEATLSTLNTWLSLVGAYYTTKSILDDPLTRSYADSYYSQFEQVDDDANYAGFSLGQQLFLAEYLTNVKVKFENLKEGRSPAETIQLTELQTEADDIQRNLTKESKKAIVKKLAMLWAKAQRIGLDVIKEIFVSVASEITTKLLTGKP